MQIVLVSVAFVFAALCAAVMGFAIQRGGTCTVAAVEELANTGSLRRLASLVEAAVWVGGGLLVLRALMRLPDMPSGFALGWSTLLGGALLGLGAFINGACVFGSIARLGSGQWVYVLTPIGFFLGCVSAPRVFSFPAPQALPYGSPVLQAPAWAAAVFLIFVAGRLAWPMIRHDDGVAGSSLALRLRHALVSRIWSPHAATTVIGIMFLCMLVTVGAWAYTDVLAELARGMAASVAARVMLALALLSGAVWGGWTAGRFQATRITATRTFLCLAGGVLMGWASQLIPGGNDGLILVGMPLLWPYAWVAFVSMCMAIAAARVVSGFRPLGVR